MESENKKFLNRYSVVNVNLISMRIRDERVFVERKVSCFIITSHRHHSDNLFLFILFFQFVFFSKEIELEGVH